MPKIFSNFEKIWTYQQRAKWTQSKTNATKTTLAISLSNWLKDKGKNFSKSAGINEHTSYTRANDVMMAADISAETLSTRRQRNNFFKVKNIGWVGTYQILYLEKKFLQKQREWIYFSNK